jgi:hypothetical protein
MFLLINFAVFQLAWLSSVLGGAMKMPWLGPVAVLVALTIHFKAARRPFEEFVLVISCALIGAAFDSMLVAMAWVTYPAGLFSSFMAPYWIITMWMLFATTLNVSMRWMRGARQATTRCILRILRWTNGLHHRATARWNRTG